MGSMGATLHVLNSRLRSRGLVARAAANNGRTSRFYLFVGVEGVPRVRGSAVYNDCYSNADRRDFEMGESRRLRASRASRLERVPWQSSLVLTNGTSRSTDIKLRISG